MIAPRRFLPSISSLLALEAVDRLGTATAAAEELSLTHSAVSRQLKVLEEQIGVSIFRREGKGLALTASGSAYASSIRESLNEIARASLHIRASGNRTSLNLAVLPAFGMHWLSPRLKQFTAANTDISMNLGTRLSAFDFGREKFDAAIHYGQRDWRGVDYLELAGERVIPACAPTLMETAAVQPHALLELPLLHLESRPGAWEEWFESYGHQVNGLRGMLFDQFSTMTEAAVLGFGVALLPSFLAEIEFQRGRLIPAFGQYQAVSGSYFLVWPSDRAVPASLCKLIKWLEGSANN